MFKALNTIDQSEIVILDTQWESQLGILRSLDVQNALTCQGCRQSVRVRAGEVRRWHFAHKHLQNCPYENESPNLLETRAVLYKWLVAKFGQEFVTLEKELRGTRLPRHVDCWVNKEGQQIAYWIFDTRLPPETRDALQITFNKSRVHINWVFVSEMLREDRETQGNLHLSTTEREFIQRSDYDEPHSPSGSYVQGSLHYVDPSAESLTTFRALRLVHDPQLYSGCKRSSPLSSVLVLGSTGEFVHPDEHEALAALRELQATSEGQTSAIEDHGRKWLAEHRPVFSLPPGQGELLHRGPPDEINKETQPRSIPIDEGVCVHCGKVTTDWWSFDGATKKCRCRECARKGLY